MKLTKEMFYKDGKFDKAAAKKAYIEMMENLGYPISDNLRENMWVSDFALGDFPAVGMGGIFWAQENVHGVFGHEILLLPNQMLIEHYHVAGNGLPAKNECWQARAGTSYCFGENGEGYLRLSYAYSLKDLERALARMERFVGRLLEQKPLPGREPLPGQELLSEQGTLLSQKSKTSAEDRR